MNSIGLAFRQSAAWALVLVLASACGGSKGGGSTQTTGGPFFAGTTLNLEQQIDLMPIGTQVTTTTISYSRSEIRIDSTDYDGTVSVFLEVTATNSDTSSREVRLVRKSGLSTVGSVTVPAGLTNSTRLRSAAFSLTSGADDYLIQVTGSGTGTVRVNSAVLVLRQVGATKTKIYVPLARTAFTIAPSNLDLTTAGSAIFGSSICGGTYCEGSQGNNRALWRKDVDNLGTLAATNPFEFEAVGYSNDGATSGQIILANVTGSTTVAATQMSFSSASVTRQAVQFASSATGFTDNATFTPNFRIVSGAGDLVFYRVGLWYRLENMTRAQVPIPLLRNIGGIALNSTFKNELRLIDLSRFSNPSAFFEMTITQAVAGSGTCELQTAGANDDSSTSGSVISGSSLNANSTSRTLVRSSALSLTSGDRYFVGCTADAINNLTGSPSVVLINAVAN